MKLPKRELLQGWTQTVVAKTTKNKEQTMTTDNKAVLSIKRQRPNKLVTALQNVTCKILWYTGFCSSNRNRCNLEPKKE